MTPSSAPRNQGRETVPKGRARSKKVIDDEDTSMVIGLLDNDIGLSYLALGSQIAEINHLPCT